MIFLGNKQTEKDTKIILVILGMVFYLGCLMSGWSKTTTHIVIEAKENDIDVSETSEKLAELISEGSTHVSIEDKIVNEFGDEGERALAIALAEHNGSINPNAINSTEVEHSVGVFQINLAAGYGNGKRVHWDKAEGKTLEEKVSWLQIPENNIKIAKQIYEDSYWYLWSVFLNGSYKKFL